MDRSSSPARIAVWSALLVGLFGALSLLRYGGGSSDGSRPALLEPAAHEGATALAFPNENELLSVDSGGTLRRWDLASGRARIASLVGRGLYRKDALRLLLDPTGSVCVSVLGGGDTCYGLDLSSRVSAVRLGRVAWARPTSDGRTLYGAEETGRRLSLFRPGAAVPTRSIPAGPGWTFSDRAALSPDGRYAAAVVERPRGLEVVASDTQSGRWVTVARVPAPVDLQFSPQGHRLGWMETTNRGRTLQIRAAGTWKPESAPAVEGGAGLFRFSPDGRHIATLDEAEREYLLAMPLPERRRERVFVLRILSQSPAPQRDAAERIHGHAAQVTDCVWSPAGRKVATLDEDGRIALWNARSGRLERFLEPQG